MIGISDKVWNKETIREELRKLCITYNNKMRYLSTSWVIERYQIVKKHPLGDVFVCPLKGLLWIIQVAQKL